MTASPKSTQAENIISKLGGITAAARVLGHRNPTTVQGWMERGFIPAHRQEEVLIGARGAGIDLQPSDFVAHMQQAAAGVELIGSVRVA